MTEQEKIELIIKGPDLSPDELTTEQRAFLEKSWDETTEAERDLFYRAWELKPGTLYYAAAHTDCSPGEIKAAAKYARSIIDRWTADGAFPRDIDYATALDLLTAIERQAQQCK